MTANNWHYLIGWGTPLLAITIMAVSWHWSQVRTARWNSIARGRQAAEEQQREQEQEREGS